MFDEINKNTPIEAMTLDSNTGQCAVSPTERSRGGWLGKMFRWKRQVGSTQPTAPCVGLFGVSQCNYEYTSVYKEGLGIYMY